MKLANKLKVNFKPFVALVVVMTVLSACGTNRRHEIHEKDTEGLFGSIEADSVSLADLPWKQLITDSMLQRYIDEALVNNPDINIALTKVQEAEAFLKQGKSAFWPSLNGRAGASYARNSEMVNNFMPRNAQSYQLMLEVGWEIDIWGKLRAAKRSVYASLLQSQAGQHAVQTRLVAAVATAYYSLMALDARLEVTRQSVAYNMELVETMKALQSSGYVTSAAIVQSEATRYAAEVMLPELQQQLLEAENAFSVLLGRIPGTPVVRGRLEEQQLHADVRVGVPAQLLRNRPDVIQTEMAVAQAFEAVNMAKASFYPSIQLTASAGLSSADIRNWFDPTAFAANVLGNLVQPIFNKRANRTRHEVAKAQREAALQQFRSVLLQAGSEVQNSLARIDNIVKKSELRNLQIESLTKSVDYSRELLQYGKANYTEVLGAEQSLLAARLNGVTDHLERLTSVLTLYKALGGGWK